MKTHGFIGWLRAIFLFPFSILMGNMTNFAQLDPDKIKFIQKEMRHEREAASFLLPRFCGTGKNYPIEKITELRRMEGGGEECIMTLVNHLVGDGGVGSLGGKREGREEKLFKSQQKVQIDEIFNMVRSEGALAEQASVVQFRKEAKPALKYWHANRTDQLIMLTASGISYAYNLDGSLRTDILNQDGIAISSDFVNLRFAADITAPSAKRHRRWDGVTKSLVAGDTTAVTTSDTPTYKMLLMAKAYAKTHRVMPLQAGGKEWYVVFMQPYSLAMLKNDPDYKLAAIQGGVRGDDNPFFTGGIPTIDGLILVEYEYVYNTTGATTRWGAGSDVNGTRTLLMGAQAIGYADLEQSAEPVYEEKVFEYNTQKGIMVSKFLGILKPRYYNTFDRGVEDFSVIAIDHYMEDYA
jgi:N4-gp56 family major capsid protein